MKRDSITYQLGVEVIISRLEIERLTRWARSGPDTPCMTMVEPGGSLYKWEKHFQGVDSFETVRISVEVLDLLRLIRSTKYAMEREYTPDSKRDAEAMHGELMKLFEDLQEEARNVETYLENRKNRVVSGKAP